MHKNFNFLSVCRKASKWRTTGHECEILTSKIRDIILDAEDAMQLAHDPSIRKFFKNELVELNNLLEAVIDAYDHGYEVDRIAEFHDYLNTYRVTYWC
jgi:hypothetical protein